MPAIWELASISARSSRSSHPSGALRSNARRMMSMLSSITVPSGSTNTGTVASGETAISSLGLWESFTSRIVQALALTELMGQDLDSVRGATERYFAFLRHNDRRAGLR